MHDPTYDQEAINAKPEWALAFWMSEYDNDNAPLGWAKYISLARGLLSKWDLVPKTKASEA